MDHGFDKIYNLFESIIAGDLPSKLDMFELHKLESRYLSEKDQQARNEIYTNICSYLTFIDKSEIGNELAREVILFLATGEKKPKSSENDARKSAVLPLMDQISRKFHIDAWRLFGVQKPFSEQSPSEEKEDKKQEIEKRAASFDNARQAAESDISEKPKGEIGKDNPFGSEAFKIYNNMGGSKLGDLWFQRKRNRMVDDDIRSYLSNPGSLSKESYDPNDTIWNTLVESTEYHRWKMKVD